MLCLQAALPGSQPSDNQEYRSTRLVGRAVACNAVVVRGAGTQFYSKGCANKNGRIFWDISMA